VWLWWLGTRVALIRVVEHPRVRAHASSLGGSLRCRIFFVGWRSWNVGSDGRRMWDGGEHLHVAATSEWPDRRDCSSVGDLAVLEGVEIILDMYSDALFDRTNTEVRIGCDCKFGGVLFRGR